MRLFGNGRIIRFARRIIAGPGEEDKPGTILRSISERIPNLITGNAKALNGGGAAALVLWLTENFGWELSSWEPWIALAVAVAGVVWRTPNQTTE